MADKKLWEVMYEAWSCETSIPVSPETFEYAAMAMLRALADEVAPEEPEPQPYPHSFTRSQWEQRMATRQHLLDGAAEAEGPA